MKKFVCMIFAALAILSSCGGGGGDAVMRRTIGDAVLRNVPGDPADYRFRVLELSLLSEVTVADSAAILTAGFRERIARDIESLEGLLGVARTTAGAVRHAGDREALTSQAGGLERRLDSLRSLTPPPAYPGRDPREVLSRVVRCSYEATDPRSGRTVAETFDFWLSPDGTRCYSKRKARD